MAGADVSVSTLAHPVVGVVRDRRHTEGGSPASKAGLRRRPGARRRPSRRPPSRRPDRVRLNFGGSSLRANQLAWEVESLVAAGLEPWEALGAATWRGGELLGEADAGVIREGGPADFLLVHGDPISDPSSLWRVWRVAWAG
jgi:hypothetical protein